MRHFEDYVASGYGVLEQIYPGQVSDLYDELRIMERVADIFLECIGVRGTLRMGPTGFRNFTRFAMIEYGITFK